MVHEKRGSEEIDVTLWLRPRRGGKLCPERAFEIGRMLPAQRQYLTRDALDEQYGPDPADVDEVCKILTASYGLRTAWRRWRALRVTGVPAAFRKLQADLEHEKARLASAATPLGRGEDAREADGSFLARTVIDLFGLDEAPEAAQPAATVPRRGARPSEPAAAGRPIPPQEIARLYDLPPGLDGAGQTIALISFGGTFDHADFVAGMRACGVAPGEVTREVVDAVDPATPSVELTIDTQVAGAFAPGARLKIYAAKDSPRGWLDALVAALADREAAPSVISISYGQPEDAFTVSQIACFEDIFKAAALIGVTVIAATGDSGPTLGSGDGTLSVAYPASSRFVLACGGTEVSKTSVGGRRSERVWNAGAHETTGGGFSARFPLPPWQQAPLCAAVARYRKLYGAEPGRGTPDLVAMAAPGFTLAYKGAITAGGGTSAVAPFIAALIVRINQRLGGPTAGFFAPLLYQGAAEGRRLFREIREGDLPPFRPRGGGWDPSTGSGAPCSSDVMHLLSGASDVLRAAVVDRRYAAERVV